jgi:serine/threonine protein kinase
MTNPSHIGKYEIQGILGRGGMGVVYRGFDPAIQRPVAIKTIVKSAMDPTDLQYALTRFRHEAQAVGRLTHPRIAGIYDYGEDDELAYIVMELVNGQSLFYHLQNKAQFELREIGEIVRQLLDGLGYAHSQGVVHRDIKPSNILVNDDGRIKISDFGIARLDTSTLTQVGEIMGSPGYMSPEQFVGTEIDARTDIYSVGVIAYELVTRRKPFTGGNVEIMRQVLNERPENPSAFNASLSSQVDWSILKALSKKPEDRFQTAEEFSSAFVKAIEVTLRVAAREAKKSVSDDSPTQRIDRNLVNAARVLAGLHGQGVDAGDSAKKNDLASEPALERPPAKEVSPFSTGAISTAAGAQKGRILFVDDEERILNALRFLFRRDYHVFTATNGPEALEFVKKFNPHLIVSDQRMPDMTGVELLREVKQLAPNSVRILLTGYSDLAAIVGSINEGEVFRFVSKPWDDEEMRKIIAQATAVALELADTAASPAILPERLDVGVLVVDAGKEVFRAAKELFGSTCDVLHAQSLDQAFDQLGEHEIAVILADIESSGDEVIPAFKLLKSEHPEILTIVLTNASDSELVIELINHAQIFRFINKPVNLKLLKQHTQAALTRYQSFKKNPQLTRQHQVAESSVADNVAERLLTRIKSVRGWFSSGS